MNEVKKILVFKLCCFGDIVFITPAIKSLKLNYPRAEITLISSSWIQNLFPLIEDADRLIVYDPPSENAGLITKIKSALSLIKTLRREKFDLVFLGHRNNMFGIILMLSGIRNRLGFSETRFMNVTAPFSKNIHENKRYLDILTQNNYMTVSPASVLKKNYDKSALKESLGFTNSKTVIGLFPFGGVNPGTKMTIKRWDIVKYLELAGRLSVSHNAGIVLFEGREDDEKFGSDVIIPEDYKVRKIDFNLMPACDLFVSGDTGPLHIAAALGIPTVGLFGPSDPLLVAPLEDGGRNAFVKLELPCSPCYTPVTAIDRKNREYWSGDNFVCRLGTNECMKELKTDEVYKAAVTILNNTQ